MEENTLRDRMLTEERGALCNGDWDCKGDGMSSENLPRRRVLDVSI